MASDLKTNGTVTGRSVDAVMSDLGQELDSWAQKFDDSAFASEDALCSALEKHLGDLQKIHDERLGELVESPDDQENARAKMVEAMTNVLTRTSSEVAPVPMAGVEATAPLIPPKKRTAAEMGVSEDGAETFEVAPKSKGLGRARASKAADKQLENSLELVKEADGKPVAHKLHYDFSNWGLTVHNDPLIVFEPKTRTGVQNIVLWAIAKKKRVRCAGFRHSWTDYYSADDQVLISIVPLKVAMDTHTIMSQKPVDPIPDGLAFVDVVGKTEDGKHLIKIGSQTTNDQFRQWCLTLGDWKYTLPLNVIMVEISFGGSNAPICHGAGIRHETLSDLVHEIEFVNALGAIQVVTDKEQLRAASGAFGLLGVVTSVTLKIDDMEYAEFAPNWTPVAQSIPPMPDTKVPKALATSFTPEQTQQHVEDFYDHCASDYYAEWFWFALQKQSWNNCWKTKKGDLRKEASVLKWNTIALESFLGIFAQVTNGLTGLSGKLQTWLMGTGARMTLPTSKPGEPTLYPVIEALHFRRGIHNMRVVDMELEIEIPSDGKGNADFSICRRAWWDVIEMVYAHEKKGKYPMRLALEMRVMGGSNVIMAPQFGNKFGTCSIEVLSSPQTPKDQWYSFMQEVSDKWHTYKDFDDRPLMVRSHWAKQWETLLLGDDSRRRPAVEHYREVTYKKPIQDFHAELAKIAAAGGYSADQFQTRFSTPLLDTLFYGS